MKLVFNPITANLDYVASTPGDVGITFPLAANLGGTGIANAAGSTLTLGAATSITGGGTLTLGGFTLTVPATGTAALLATENIFTATQQITVPTTTLKGLILKTSDNNVTKVLLDVQDSIGANIASIGANGAMRAFVTNTTNTIGLGAEYYLNINAGATAVTAEQYAGYYNLSLLVGQTAAVTTVYGIKGVVNSYGNNAGGQISLAAGLFFQIANRGAGYIDRSYALYLGPPLNTGGGLHGHTVGVYIESQTGGYYDNHAIYTNLGLNHFGDQVYVVGAADRNQLIVTGFTTQTLPLAHMIDNTAATNVIRNVLQLEARSTGTPAANFGVGLPFYAETATNGTYQQQGLISTAWVDATNASRKAKLALSAYDTAERKGIEIRANGTTPDIVLLGDTWWEGEGFGLPYGSIYGNDIAWTQATAAQDTWYEIADADIADGQLNLFTHDGNGKLTVTKAGRYHIMYHVVATCSIANKDLQTGISISGTEQNDGLDHEFAPTPNEQVHMASVAILDLAASATIEISLRTTDTETPDIGVEHINVAVFMLGGT